jgi:putative polyketide hydroxylase
MNVQRTRTENDVLVVGGGLIGLTTALLLRHHGVAVTLLEQHAGTSPQPKARRFHVRSMEIFRELGLADRVHQAAAGLADHQRMAVGRTLTGAEQLPAWPPPPAGGSSGGPGEHLLDISPEPPCLLAQDTLEPLLREAAVEAGADVRFQTRLVSFRHDPDGVAVTAIDRPSGQEVSLRGRYLVAADGARSPVREALGIRRSGRGVLGNPNVNVYFRADLADVVRGREFNLCQITHPDAPGAFASVDGQLRWIFMTPSTDADRDWPTVLEIAVGRPLPDLTVLSVLPWQAEMLVAERYLDGRVLLAGDAAHVMPPWAASGANTGIADAHNLAWKLAAVLSGQAHPELLTSYDSERRAAGWFTAEESSRRTLDFRPGAAPADPTLAHPLVLAAGGWQYPRGAICGEPVGEPVTEFAPSGRLGTRVPHRWLDPARTRSTLDLAGPGWALAVAGEPERWRSHTGIAAHRVEVDFLPPGHALLLRPDHVVAWRGTEPAAAGTALRQLLTGYRADSLHLAAEQADRPEDQWDDDPDH